MAYTTTLKYEPVRSIDSATFTGSYQDLGAPLAHPGTIVKLVNHSNQFITISTDGINDEDVAPANSFWLYDSTSNRIASISGLFIPQGTQFRVKGSAGTGLVYLVVQYITQIATPL